MVAIQMIETITVKVIDGNAVLYCCDGQPEMLMDVGLLIEEMRAGSSKRRGWLDDAAPCSIAVALSATQATD
jgi:hypothetical protein